MQAALEVKRNLPDSLLENPIMNRFFESFLSIEVHVLIRFGKWTEILGKEIPTDHKVLGLLDWLCCLLYECVVHAGSFWSTSHSNYHCSRVVLYFMIQMILR